MYQKFLICLVFLFTTHGLFAQNKSETANLFNLGAPVASCEANLKNFLENFPLYIENAQTVALIDYNYVGAIKNGEEARNYAKANFNGPLFAVSKEIIEEDQRLIFLFLEDESADRDALLKDADNYADEFVKIGDQVYAINYVYEGKTYTYYVFIDPVTNQVLTYKNMFGFDVLMEHLAVIANLREGALRATSAIMAGEVEKAVTWMVNMANDNSHGYDQTYRWGERGDYDCSSAVITAWQQAGVTVKSAGATYTGNMYSVFTSKGFKNVTGSVSLSNGSGMLRGDVLLNTTHHTAMVVNNNASGSNGIVHASINEKGTATGGTPGDQTGKEFCTRTYYNYPWNYVLRYPNTPANLTLNLSSSSTVNSSVSNSQVAGKTVYLWINDGTGTAVNRQNCTLTSSSPGVATISVYGTIVAVSAGTTVIKAVRNSDKIEGTLTFTVTPNNTALRLVIGSEANAPYGTILNAAAIPYGKDVYLGIDGNSGGTPTWLSRSESVLTSSNENVATISSTGAITPVGNGTTTISATNGGRVGSINLSVTGAVAVTGVTMSPGTLSLIVGGTSTLTATVNPSNASNKNVTWESNAEGIAKVDNTGKVTAVADGTATITVTTVDGNKTAICAVTVTNLNGETVAVTDVTVSPTTLSLNVGGTSTLTATVNPSNASNKNVTWLSSATGIATVDDNTGKVTAVAAGTATITAITADGGKTATCAVTVVPNDNGQLKLTIVARKVDSSQAVTDEPLRTLPENTLASVTGSGCLFINDVETGKAVTRSTTTNTEPPTSYEISPAGMATVSDFGGISTLVSSGWLTIKATNDGRSGSITIPIGEMVGLFNPAANVIKVSPTETGVIAEFGGSATIEVYTVNGVLIDKAKAFQSYSRHLTNGVYIIRINGQAVKFVK